jgi:drug/metabolite transporter (DMT)-like permease
MNALSRTVTGSVMILIGAGMLIGALFASEFGGSLSLGIYGGIIFVLGIVILLNKKEDEIEGILENKCLKGGKKK